MNAWSPSGSANIASSATAVFPLGSIEPIT